jgi:hypothetical protein
MRWVIPNKGGHFTSDRGQRFALPVGLAYRLSHEHGGWATHAPLHLLPAQSSDELGHSTH